MESTPTIYGDVDMPIYQGVKGSTVILVADWRVSGILPDGRVFRIHVKKGFVFDGASIPRFLWRLCGHPLEAPRIAAEIDANYAVDKARFNLPDAT